MGDLGILSTLTRGVSELVLLICGAGDMERSLPLTGGVDTRRPKKDNKPPFGFFIGSIATSFSFSFSMTRQPGGKKSSDANSGLDLTDVSHAVDPFDDV